MFNAYYIDWDGNKSDDQPFATLAEAMEWIQDVIFHTSLDCECEEDTLRTRYGVTFDADGAYNLINQLPSSSPKQAREPAGPVTSRN